ncbi:flagellar export protein FliJ [bacterium]|nr:flagellar export protein FliJ [bacterium]
MKRFRFRLQKVLDAREVVEREAQRKLGEAQRVLTELETVRNQIQTDIAQLTNEQRNMLGGTVTAGTAMQHHRWLRELEKRLRVQIDKCRDAEKAVAERRQELLDASRERKVLDRLKEKKRAEHMQLALKEQQATLDDIGGRAAARAESTSGQNPSAGYGS